MFTSVQGQAQVYRNVSFLSKPPWPLHTQVNIHTCRIGVGGVRMEERGLGEEGRRKGRGWARRGRARQPVGKPVESVWYIHARGWVGTGWGGGEGPTGYMCLPVRAGKCSTNTRRGLPLTSPSPPPPPLHLSLPDISGPCATFPAFSACCYRVPRQGSNLRRGVCV